MDYLIFEGYQTAASAFANEANIEPSGDGNLLEERLRIRDAIFRGDLQGAIEEINDIDPEVSTLPIFFAQHFHDDLFFHAPRLALRGFDDSKHFTSVLSLIETLHPHFAQCSACM